MKYKNYKDQIFEQNFGTIVESGLPTYYLLPDIKEIEIDGKWIPNPVYDLEKVKSNKLFQIESQLLDNALKLDKAKELALQTQITDLNSKISSLQTQKDELNAIE